MGAYEIHHVKGQAHVLCRDEEDWTHLKRVLQESIPDTMEEARQRNALAFSGLPIYVGDCGCPIETTARET